MWTNLLNQFGISAQLKDKDTELCCADCCLLQYKDVIVINSNIKVNILKSKVVFRINK